MTDDEIIAIQAKKMMELEADNSRMMVQLSNIQVKLISFVAPLNDNFLQYNKEQLKLFLDIQDILDGCVD
jgi:DNA-dependent RNA polymerase auxiliary subunit epsilon